MDLKKLFYQMILIRRFEEKVAEMFTLGHIGGFCHLYIGQEAVCVGAISCLREDDYVLSAYRDHGHCIIKGSSPKKVMAELFGKATGLCRGKGGSMHLFDAEKNFLGGFAIVGGHLPIATGAAFAIKYQKKDQVVLCFFGEGAVNIGAFHESLNIAATWKLPVIYLCENNRYGMGTPIERATSLYDICQKACAYSMERDHIDGMDVLAVRESVEKAIQRAREHSIPTLIEARTYRFRGHSMLDPAHYRTKEELEEQLKRDPIGTFKEKLLKEDTLTDSAVRSMEEDVKREIDEAVDFAMKSPAPSTDTILEDLYI
ncbi:MAG: pyruvate dehydrogenase (acetyl-transferring) E1 component subunit alpha [Candidatus Omnitrophica bacterium]|nr:pyruvate dehydrogenase (acetyl-transferring) E1 component subunit alpha [Candidatus Omnitrophota bacterium]